MKYVERKSFDDGTLTLAITGHIDSANAAEFEGELTEARKNQSVSQLILDAQGLEYISSAGLRVILRLLKESAALEIINVNPEVYEIFDMTGFTEMTTIRKAYRVISVDGCEVIGQGANGKVYRIDPDTIVKVYLNPDALPEIHRERELARTAFVLGIPTAIPYDVVRVGDGYGSVFELLNARSFAKLLISGEKSLDEIAQMSVELLKHIHATEVKPGIMPDMREVAMDWAAFLEPYLPGDVFRKLTALVAAVPEDHHMMHGDYHLKNIMLQNGETLLIDMDTLCMGHPVFELASMFNAYYGYSELDPSNIEAFLGITLETGWTLWRKMLALYLDTDDPARIESVEKKAMVVGYTRNMRRLIRRNGLNNPEGLAQIEYCRRRLGELVPEMDTLLF